MNKVKTCDICGVSNENKRIKYNAKTKMFLCEKHYGQYKIYGKFFDSSKITTNDMNEISIDKSKNIAYIHLYDKHGIELYKALIDIDDVEKCSKRRWRISKKKDKIYVVSGSVKNKMVYLSRYLLNYYGMFEVDHIDGNSLNNCKYNLRIVERKYNVMNTSYKSDSKTKIRGVSYDKFHNTYSVDFSCNRNRFYFKPFKTIEEATYIRYLCEKNFLKEFRHTSNDEKIIKEIGLLSDKEKTELENYFYNKVNGRKIQ